MLLLIDNYDSFSYNLYQLVGEVLLESGKKDLQNPDHPDIRVIRNDELTVKEIQALHPEGIIISPGPGRPADAGICEALVRAAAAGPSAGTSAASEKAGSAAHQRTVTAASNEKASPAAVRIAGAAASNEKTGRTTGAPFPPILGVCLGEQAICEAMGATITYARHLMHGKQSEVRLNLLSPLFQGLPEVIPAARYHSLAVEADTLPPDLEIIATADDGEIMGVQHTTRPIYGLQFHPESIMTPDGSRILENFVSLCSGQENSILSPGFCFIPQRTKPC